MEEVLFFVRGLERESVTFIHAIAAGRSGGHRNYRSALCRLLHPRSSWRSRSTPSMFIVDVFAILGLRFQYSLCPG